MQPSLRHGQRLPACPNRGARCWASRSPTTCPGPGDWMLGATGLAPSRTHAPPSLSRAGRHDTAAARFTGSERAPRPRHTHTRMHMHRGLGQLHMWVLGPSSPSAAREPGYPSTSHARLPTARCALRAQARSWPAPATWWPHPSTAPAAGSRPGPSPGHLALLHGSSLSPMPGHALGAPARDSTSPVGINPGRDRHMSWAPSHQPWVPTMPPTALPRGQQTPLSNPGPYPTPQACGPQSCYPAQPLSP